MTKYSKYLVYIIIIGCITWFIYDKYSEQKAQLGIENMGKFHQILYMNKSLVDDLTVLEITTDLETRQDRLISIIQNSFALSNAWKWDYRELYGLQLELDMFYGKIIALSQYLLDKPTGQSFNGAELKQIKLARDSVKIIDTGLNGIWNLKLDKEQWADIMKEPKVQAFAQKSVTAFSELPPFYPKQKPIFFGANKTYTGEKVSKSEAIQKATNFLGPELLEKYKVIQSGGGTDEFGNEQFQLTLISKDTKEMTDIGMDVAVKGGHIIRYWTDMWMEGNKKEYGEPKYSIKEAEGIAQPYLKRWKSDLEMELIESKITDSIGFLTYAALWNGIPVYHQQVEIAISLDKGELVSFEAVQFYRNLIPNRDLPKPTLRVEKAKQSIPMNKDFQDLGLAIIRNRSGSEVITYRFLKKGEPSLIIFINAVTGLEERIHITGGGQF